MIIYKRKKKQLVIPCGIGPVICEDEDYRLQMKQVDSSTVLQHIEPDGGYYGLYRVIVNPYTVEWLNRPITGNGSYVITPENADALAGVEIDVNVQPTLQDKTVDSSTVTQNVAADEDYDGLGTVTVNPYTLESKSQVITVNGEYTVTATSADGLSSVDISVNVADIPAVVQAKTADSSTETQVITPDEGYDGLSQVTIDPYTLESKSDTITDNGMYTYYPNTADGLDQVIIDVSVDTVNNQSKAVDSSTEMQYVQPDPGYTGLDYVAVNPYTLDSKTVDSSTVSQTIVSDEDGLSSVIVNPYTLESKSDTLTANGQYTYTADNADALSEVTIDVSINTVNNQSKTADSSTVSQAITPDQGYTGLDSVTINPYVLDSKTVDSSTVSQTIVSDEDGLSSVTVNPYTLDSKTVNSSTSQQVITSDEDGLSSVTVNPYTLESKSDTLTANGQYTYTANNADALSQVTIDVSINTVNNQSKTADSSTVSQNITPDSGYTGLDSVTINPYVLDSKTVDSSTVSQVITSDEDGLSSVTVNPYVLDSKTVDSSTVTQVVTSDADGLSSVTVNPYVTNNQDKELKISGYYFDLDSSITADAGYSGLNSVKINMPDSGYYIVQAFGKGGYTMNVNRYIPKIDVRDLSLQSKVVSDYGPGTDASILPDDGYDGFTDIKINHQSSDMCIWPNTGEIIWNSSHNRYHMPSTTSVYPGRNISYLNLYPVLLQSNKTVDASTVSQTVTFDEYDSSLMNAYFDDPTNANPECLYSRYQGLKQVTVNPVTASIDSNIQAGNIKNGVTILGVTGSYSGGGGSDYVIAARKGTMTDLSGYTLDAVTRDNQYNSLFLYTPITKMPALPDPGNYKYVYKTAFHNCTSLSGAIDLSNVTNISTETFRDAFTYDAYITSVDMSNVASIGNYGAYGMFYGCSRLASFDLSSLTTVGDNGLYQTFSGCTALTSVDLPELTSLGYYGMSNAFYGCSNLTTVNMPKLTNTGTYGTYYAFYNTNVQTCTIHPDALTRSGLNYNPLYHMTSLVTLNLSQKVTKDCYINRQANLSAASIQDILEKLDLSVSGKSITFSNNTVIDTQAKEYSTPYNAAIAAGWTIYNLTVIPFVTLKVNTPADGLLNLKNSSTIDFDSESAWTVTTSDPSVHVSQASGAAGTGIQLTVTYDSGYSGDSTITIANQYDSVQITARYNAETYTRLEYITNVQGQEADIQLPNNMLNKDSVIQFTVNYRSHNGSKFLSTTVTDGYTEEWRVFGYSNNLYTDIGGGSGGGRYYNGYTFNTINGQFGTIEVGVNSSNCTYQKNVSTGDTYTSPSSNSFSSTAPYYLNYISSDGEKTWLRELKVYINGISNGLTYDYVAAKDSNDVPGLWDMVRDEFYTNPNGRIAAGPVLSV